MATGSGSGGIRLRPLDIGDVLDETFRVYRRQFLSLITAMAVVVVPTSLLSLLIALLTGINPTGMNRFNNIQDGRDFAAIAVAVVVIVIVAIVASLAHLVAAAAIIQIASGGILGEPVSIGAAFRRGLGSFGWMLLASIVIGVPISLLVITCIGIPVAIYLGLGWALVFQAIVLEGYGPMGALGRSSGLVDGHRWRLLACTLLIGLITAVLVSVPAGLFGFIGGIVAVATGGSPAALTMVQVGNVVFQALGQTLFGAIAYITTTLLYYDLRIRKEAFDLQQRLPQPGAPQSPLDVPQVPPF
jgi:hypothetical protein